MSIFNNELLGLEKELKGEEESIQNQANHMEELRKQSVVRVMRTFDLYLEAAKEYVASAPRFGITTKTFKYRAGKTFFTNTPKYVYSQPVFDVLLPDRRDYCADADYYKPAESFYNLCISPTGEVLVECSENNWQMYSSRHRQKLIDHIEKNSHFKKADKTRYAYDIADTLRLLTYNHSPEIYDDGDKYCYVYLDQPKREEEIKEEIKERFFQLIRTNQKISK